MTEEELPNGWAWTTLGEICTGAEQVNPADVFPSEFRYLEISSIDNRSHQFVDPSVVGVDEAPSRARQFVRAGDTLFSTVRTNLKNIALVSQRYDRQICSTGFSVLRPKTDIEQRYIFYFVITQSFVDRVSALQRGVSYPAVRDAEVRAQAIPLAPANEQRRIVERIDELFSQIEAGEAALARAKRLLARYRQAVLKAAVTGELTRDWRERHQTVIEPATHLLDRILQARREAWEKAELEKLRAKGKAPKDDKWKQKYKDPEPPDTTDLPELPGGWVWAAMGQLFRVSVGATPDRANPRYWNGDIPWISSGEVRFSTIHSSRETISEAGLRNSSTHWLDVGTVLMAMIGEGKTRGQAALLEIRACANQNACAIHVSRTPISPSFVYFYLMSQYDENRRISSGGNQPALNSRRVMDMTIPLPPLEEITQINDRVADHISILDHLDGEIVDCERRAAALRQAILTAAFAGKLVPQDPADEPAVSLLDRIRAERPTSPATKPRRGRPPSGIAARGAVGGDLPLFSGHAAAGGDRS